MPYYRICPDCHAYLDFGEQCDCHSQPELQTFTNHKKKAAPELEPPKAAVPKNDSDSVSQKAR